MSDQNAKDLANDLPDRINETLMQVFNQIVLHRRVSHKLGGKIRLTMVEAEMCLLIKRRSGIIGSEIAEALDVTRSATSQFISKLKDKGLVTVEPDAVNARLKRVYLTESGKEAAAAAQGYADQMLKALYDVPEEELRHYLEFVTKLQRFHTGAIERLKN